MKCSILTSNYNCGKYIEKCIDSVLRQAYKDWEMVIVDDCSTDKSASTIKRFAERDSRIKHVKTPHRLGCGGAYSFGLTFVTGEITCILDADDSLGKKSVKRIVEQYTKYPDIDFIYTQFYLCNDRLKVLKTGFSRSPGKQSLLEAGLGGKHCYSHWRTFRTNMRDKCSVFNPALKAAVDKWMGYTLEENGFGAFYDKPLYYYRQRLGGLSFTGRKAWKHMKEQFKQKRDSQKIVANPIITIV